MHKGTINDNFTMEKQPLDDEEEEDEEGQDRDGANEQYDKDTWDDQCLTKDRFYVVILCSFLFYFFSVI